MRNRRQQIPKTLYGKSAQVIIGDKYRAAFGNLRAAYLSLCSLVRKTDGKTSD